MEGVFDFDSTLYGSVHTSENTYVINNNHKALPNDIVQCKNNTICKITQRSKQLIPGILKCNAPIYGIVNRHTVKRLFVPHNRSYPTFIVNSKKINKTSDEYGCITFLSWDNDSPIGEYKNRIGNIGDIEAEKEYHIITHIGKCMKYPKKSNMNIYSTDLTPDRKDLTDIPCISIDPDGCQDVDDALHYRKINDNLIELGIHIADVSSYIPVGSNLDIEAAKRVESVYLAWKQIDMLPLDIVKDAALSGLSRSFTVLVVFDTNLNIVDSHFIKTMIKVDKNYSYDEAEQSLQNKDNNQCETLVNLYKFGQKLYNSKQIIYDKKYDTHKMVEIYMILCNLLVAKKLKTGKIHNLICRKHDGCTTDLDVSQFDDNLQKSIMHYNMSAAEYTLNEGKHKSLNQEIYTHFTSPLRRYIDIIIHRMLYDTINLNKNNVIDGNLSDLIVYINKMHYNIHKAGRGSYILMQLYKYYIDDNIIFDTDGYIVKINDNNVIIHDYNTKLDVICPLYSNKIKHLLKIDCTLINIKLQSLNTKCSIEFKIGQKVKLKTIISFRENRLSKKVIGQLIDPNPIDIHEFSLYDCDIDY